MAKQNFVMTETHEVQLPIRLVPRRGQTLFQLALSLAWCAFVIYWTVRFAEERDVYPAILVCLPLILLGLGVYSFSRSVFQLLPGSRFDHILLTREGFGFCRRGRLKFELWPVIRHFAGYHKHSLIDGGFRWVIEAVGREVTRGGLERPGKALVSFDLNGYLPVFHSQQERDDMVAWLSSLPALASEEGVPERIQVPRSLLPCVYRIVSPERPRVAGDTGSRYKNVIER